MVFCWALANQLLALTIGEPYAVVAPRDVASLQVVTNTNGDTAIFWQSKGWWAKELYAANKSEEGTWVVFDAMNLDGGAEMVSPFIDESCRLNVAWKIVKQGQQKIYLTQGEGKQFIPARELHSLQEGEVTELRMMPEENSYRMAWVQTFYSKADKTRFGECISVASLIEGQKPAIQQVSKMFEFSNRAKLAFDAAGNAFAVWIKSKYDYHKKDSVPFCLEASSQNKGQQWSAYEKIEGTDLNGSDDFDGMWAVRDKEDNATVLWVLKNKNSTARQLMCVTKFNGRWGPVIPLTLEEEGISDPEIAIDPAGNVLALWCIDRKGQKLVRAAYKPLGKFWDFPYEISSPYTSSLNPKLSIDYQGQFIVVWNQLEQNQTFSICGSTFSTKEEMWSDRFKISLDGQACESPAFVVSPNGKGCVAWVNSFNKREIQVAELTFK